eukprot:CAMPEP_0116131550 /NCGR_PEP_ID=MMETSP0329-20121206/9068_1 /TAXON_ID=697910 /ORGANISM="Pseudo-nitzschia arenysensis, Strain B593" /LENGTH=500 /DNA_ID=CAMNT_0003625993 /DNA_START=248 /DNA_END=1751 /DNA_ORIENTATION=+
MARYPKKTKKTRESLGVLVPKECLQIQRGGANRFVDDDDATQNTNNNESNNNYGDSTRRMNLQENINSLRKHSPVVYQYFGRSRSRGVDDAPVNFILLGPNVDHWKTVGQTLASRGFNVMACERMVEDKKGRQQQQQQQQQQRQRRQRQPRRREPNYEDAPDLVLEILDALKWDKAVLVGCDEDSCLALETAMELAPERVAGLILCGDLTASNQFAVEAVGDIFLDSFLHRALDCPFVIVWDGGARSVVSGSSVHEAIETKSSPFGGEGGGVDGRCVILGGGSAPHRTKPEYFAWVLARFVEEKLESHSMKYVGGGRRKQREALPNSSMGDNPRPNFGGLLQNLNLPFGIDSLVSPEGRLLLGRAVAAAIFYTSVMKVIFVQYGILRMGLISVKNSVDSVDALRRKIFQVTGAFIWNLGYIPRLFKFSLKRTKELEDDDMDGTTKELEDAPEGDKATTDESIASDSPSATLDSDEDIEKEEDEEENVRIKPLFFLDNIFT